MIQGSEGNLPPATAHDEEMNQLKTQVMYAMECLGGGAELAGVRGQSAACCCP